MDGTGMPWRCGAAESGRRALKSSLSGCRPVGLPSPGAAAALASGCRRFASILGLVGLYHFAARGIIGIGQVHPPLSLDAIDFARLGPQLQEIDRGAETGLLGHAPDGLGIGALETGLHEPDFP